MIRLVVAFAAVPVATANSGPAAEPPKDDFSLQDLPDPWLSAFRLDKLPRYTVDPYLHVAARLQSLGKEKADAMLQEFAKTDNHRLAGKPESGKEYLAYCSKECDWSSEKFTVKSAEQKNKVLEKFAASPKFKKPLDKDEKEFLIADRIDSAHKGRIGNNAVINKVQRARCDSPKAGMRNWVGLVAWAGLAFLLYAVPVLILSCWDHPQCFPIATFLGWPVTAHAVPHALPFWFYEPSWTSFQQMQFRMA